tara:strand:+ start:2406 stop:3011 length:606 start_codon:yes stop_codon:yes gene_type:complete
MKKPRILVFGASGHGLVVAEAAAASGWEVIGFADDGVETGTRVGSWNVLDAASLGEHDLKCIVAIGVNGTRRKVAARFQDQLVNVIHPSAMMSPSATLQKGIFVGPRAVVHAEANLGEGAIINSGAIVEHHVEVGAYAHIAPGAVLAGAVKVGEETLVGANAVVIQGCEVGSRVNVGAGAAVIRSVADDLTVVGVPARALS